MAKEMLSKKKGSAEGRNPAKCQTISGAMPKKAITTKERSGPISK